jgi:hypothetical protein
VTEGGGNPRLAVLLAMAMFVLVVDTSLMNVPIASVVEDLDTTVSGVPRRPGRDRPHQHGRAAGRPPGGPADPDPRRPARAVQSFRMMRLPDPAPSRSVEDMVLG